VWSSQDTNPEQQLSKNFIICERCFYDDILVGVMR
jgi:hypothetical protein